MEDRQITAVLPSEVARELIDAGGVVPVPTTRTGLPWADIVVTGLTVVTTTITFAQAPSAIEDVTRRLVAWRRRSTLSRDPTVSIEASGPNGHISLRLRTTTSREELGQAISLVLSRSDAVEPAEAEPPAPSTD